MPAKITVRPVKKTSAFLSPLYPGANWVQGLGRIQYGPGHESSLAATSSQTDSLSMQVRPSWLLRGATYRATQRTMKPPRSACSEAARGLWTPGAWFGSLEFLSSRRGEACGMRCEPSEDVTKETGTDGGPSWPWRQSVVFVACWGGSVQVLESAQESVWHSGESQRPPASAEVLSMLWKGGGQRGVGTRGVMCQAHLKAHLTARGRQGFTARPQSRGCFAQQGQDTSLREPSKVLRFLGPSRVASCCHCHRHGRGVLARDFEYGESFWAQTPDQRQQSLKISRAQMRP